jgi:hypothetical protein
MSSRKTLELFLDRIELGNCGSANKRVGKHVLLVSLVWPRPAIAERNAVKTFSLEDNAANLEDSDWMSRILFKETVAGTFGIKVTVTEPMTDGQIGKFFSYAGSSMMKLAGDQVSGLISGAVGGGLAEIPFQFLAKAVKGVSSISANILGAGSTEVNVSSSSKSAKKMRLEIPLVVPRVVYATRRKGKHGNVTTRRRVILKEGESNGRLFLTAKIK